MSRSDMSTDLSDLVLKYEEYNNQRLKKFYDKIHKTTKI